MNDYRITYTTEAGESFDSTITERTEAAARKFFNAVNKGLGHTITATELIRENTCATKQQERDTLEAIKKMIAELGPQSYLATAFEGCFQDAEDNIDDDAAYSMKARYESAELQVKKLEAELRKAQQGIEELIQKDDERKAALEKMAGTVLGPDDLEDVHQLITSKVLELGAEVSNAAERVVEAAGEPDSAAFQNAVKDHRAAKSNLSYYTAFLTRVNNIKNIVEGR